MKSLENELKEPYVKPVKGKNYKGLFELRIKFSSDIARIFYFIYYDKRVILLSGFIKKTVKTPKIELNRAKNIWMTIKEEIIARNKAIRLMFKRD